MRSRDDVLLRAELLSELRGLLAPGRAVTLVGAGGMGKSWLARRVEREALFVDCIPARTLDDLTRLVGDSLGLATRGSAEQVLEGLSGGLVRCGRLLVLDNLEQVLEPAGRLVQALAQGKGQVLATSRVPLGVPAERVCPVPPLEPAQALAHFLRGADPSTLAGQDADLHALIELLDGNPLAIEIAAGNTSLASPGQLLERLRANRPLVDVEQRSARHRSVDQVGEHSWSLLKPSTRAALRRLALLEGDWELEAALSLGVEVPCVEALRRWSLLRRVQTSPTVRLRIPAGLRGWLLRAHPPTLEDREAVARWANRRAERAVGGLGREDEDLHRELLLALFPNLAGAAGDTSLPNEVRVEAFVYGARYLLNQHGNHALSFMEQHAELQTTCQEQDLRLALVRSRALRRMGRQDEAMESLDLALERSWSPHAEGELRAERALLLASGRHRSESAQEAERAVALLKGAESPAEALAYRQLGVAYRVTHVSYTRSREALERSIAISRRLGLVSNEVAALAQLMQLTSLVKGEAVQALYHQGLEAAERSGFKPVLALLQGQYSLRLLSECDAERAREVVPAVIEVYRDRGLRAAADNLRCRLSLVEAVDQPPEVARGALQALLAESRRSQVSAYEPDMLSALGVLDHLEGRLDRALRRYQGAEERAQALDRGNAKALAEQLIALLEAERSGGVALGAQDPVVAAVEGGWRGELDASQLGRVLSAHPVGHMSRLRDKVAMRSALLQDRWVFQEDARAFEPPAGGRVDLGRRQASRRILQALLQRRLSEPGLSLSSLELITLGWPGERIRHESAQARLWTAIRDLRSLGLEELLQTSGEGYRLDPRAALHSVPELRR